LLLLRFDLTLPPQATVVEAYLVLERIDAGTDDVFLHAARIVEPWNGASVSWALQPKLADIGPLVTVTHVLPTMRGRVRLDVGELVSRWRERRADDFGVAVVAEAPPSSAAGVAFALMPLVSPRDGLDVSSHPRPPAAPAFDQAEEPVGPTLELYVK
jgi:hypothetical protein